MGLRYHRSDFSFSPIGGQYFRGAVKWLIIANIAVFFIQMLWGRQCEMLFGLVPAFVWQKLMIWQLFSYMFLHGGVFHLLFNMFLIWMFGRSIESQWGTSAFLKYYVLTGLGAGLLTILFTPNASIPTIGASGAVYGLLVAFAMMYPSATIYLYFFIPVTARQMVIFLAVIEFFASASGTPDGIARFAHLGGMLFGYLYLKFGDRFRIQFKGLFRGGSSPSFGRKTHGKKRRTGTFDDLSDEVNKILDKILVKGPGSLTKEEEEIMRRYSKRKH